MYSSASFSSAPYSGTVRSNAYTLELSETTTPVDAVDFSISRVFSEVAVFIDTITFTSIFNIALTEATTLTDTIAKRLVKLITMTETTTLFDSVVLSIIEGVNARLTSIKKSIGQFVGIKKTIGQNLVRSAPKKDPTRYTE